MDEEAARRNGNGLVMAKVGSGQEQLGGKGLKDGMSRDGSAALKSSRGVAGFGILVKSLVGGRGGIAPMISS